MRVKSVEERLNASEALLKTQQARIVKLEKINKELLLAADLMDDKKARKTLQAAHKEAANLHRHLQLMIEKITVCTEVNFFARHRIPTSVPDLNAALIAAFDRPDEWWSAGKDLSVRDWTGRIMKDRQPSLIVPPQASGFGPYVS